MSRWDEVDRQRARQYAWSLRIPDEPGAVAGPDGDELRDEAGDEAADEPADEPSPQELAMQRAEARAASEHLAAAIERVWNAPAPVEQQARQTESLLESAGAAGLGMVALSRHARAHVRLARLANRHWQRLSGEAREAAPAAFFWLRCEHPEILELLVELAQTGNRLLAQGVIMRQLGGESDSELLKLLRNADLSPRLLALLERADELERPWNTRLLALDWLGLSRSTTVIPMLRRLLRLPHLGVRWRALNLLLHGFRPSPVADQDILFLLEDLLVQPPLLDKLPALFEEPLHYAESLEQAITMIHPAGGAEVLERIAFGGRPLRRLCFSECGSPWALRVLAAAYPERAVPHLDHCARSSSSHLRLAAVAAAARLPPELARPRLYAAAADSAPRVAERARELWFDRFGTCCAVEPLAGFPVELLEAPASERLLGRLLVLRGPSEPARQAMLEVLLDEAPDREALALIVFALGDDHLLLTRHRPGLPPDARKLAARLCRLFGAAAVLALRWLAERYRQGGGVDWFWEAAQLVHARHIRKRDAGPLRELALQRLDTESGESQRHALRMLARLGAPRELRERLFALLCQPGSEYVFALDVLSGWPRDRSLDALIAETARTAWAAGDSRVLRQVALLGCKRRVDALAEIAAQVVERWLMTPAATPASGEPPDMPAAALAEQCARHLLELEKLPADWLLESLRAPQSPAFLLAGYLLSGTISPEIRQALHHALDVLLPHTEAARVAATALLRVNAIVAGDPRLLAVVTQAPRDVHRFLLFQLAHRRAPREVLLPLLSNLLRSATREDGDDLERFLNAFTAIVEPAALLAELPHVPDAEVRRALEVQLRARIQEDGFWQDGADESM